ncbi:helicase-associated domain-containing protein [Leifsonia sp. NPDC056665]|uniref:helicase-associated domain-containing protein n=1 Tax=Leifsonia sp. NPDC056665 TaxID=3345901 RepID=UPI00367EEDF1
MTTTLALAARLRALPDDELAALLRARPVRRAGISDFFDLAEALLDPESVQRALAPLDRLRLATLAVLGEADGAQTVEGITTRLGGHPATAGTTTEAVRATVDALAALALLHPADDGAAAYDAVTARLAAWPALGLPRPAALLDTAPPAVPEPLTPAELAASERLAAERAFEAVAGVSELLTELGREGARELQKGGLALPAAKRLADALAVDAAVVPVALSVAARAGLAAVADGLWLPTAAVAAWQHSTTADRWRDLAGAWLAGLPGDVRALLTARSRSPWGESLRAHLAWLYPAAVDETEQRVDQYVREAEWLGVTAGRFPGDAGALLLEAGPAAATVAMVVHFPAEVSQVYLQHDLSVISPGPLAPDVEARLRTMADLESRALASTFRFSAASIDRAVTAGETAASIHDFLAAVSLTGVPQPLDYLIADAVERHGRVRVRDAGPGAEGQAVVRSDDATLLGTIAVDQSLSSLRLLRADERTLVSRFPRDVVYWALSDARYPVVAEDASGALVTPQRRRIAERTAAAATRDTAAELVARLRSADPAEEDTGEQWLARQLDQAVRARQTVVVQVAMPDGRLVDYLLEPTGIGGGRLRGRDRAADIERTLPLSSVKGLRSVD